MSALDAVLGELSNLGAEVVDIKMQDVTPVAAAWWDLATVEAAAFHANTFPSRADEYGPGFTYTLRHGVGVSGVAYANAAKVRAEFSGRMSRVLESVDLMVCPSMSNAARLRLADPFAPDTDESWATLVLNDIHTKPFNFSGSPTLSVPCGFSADGLSLSVQFVGPSLSEGILCRAGHAYEPYDLLLGRNTHEIFASSFANSGNGDPTADRLNKAEKYVVTSSLNDGMKRDRTERADRVVARCASPR